MVCGGGGLDRRLVVRDDGDHAHVHRPADRHLLLHHRSHQCRRHRAAQRAPYDGGRRRHRAGSAIWVEVGEGESGIAPGQACVFYSDDGNDARVYGGGFIERSERGADAEAKLSRLASRPRSAAPA